MRGVERPEIEVRPDASLVATEEQVASGGGEIDRAGQDISVVDRLDDVQVRRGVELFGIHLCVSHRHVQDDGNRHPKVAGS